MCQPVYIFGDIHGNFLWVRYIARCKHLEKCVLISVGDFGIGFTRNLTQDLKDLNVLNNFLIERQITLYVIRGNHDNPNYFNGNVSLNYSNIHFVADYTLLTIDNIKYLLVGGAISIDRKIREINTEWWSDEVFVLDESKIVECDVLITHTTPTWLGPLDKSGYSYYCDNDPTLTEDLIKERRDIDTLVRLCKPKRLYAGHFHAYYYNEFEGCVGRILDIKEIISCYLYHR